MAQKLDTQDIDDVNKTKKVTFDEKSINYVSKAKNHYKENLETEK